MPKNPEWKTQQPFKAVLENDMQTLAASGEKAASFTIDQIMEKLVPPNG